MVWSMGRNVFIAPFIAPFFELLRPFWIIAPFFKFYDKSDKISHRPTGN